MNRDHSAGLAQCLCHDDAGSLNTSLGWLILFLIVARGACRERFNSSPKRMQQDKAWHSGNQRRGEKVRPAELLSQQTGAWPHINPANSSQRREQGKLGGAKASIGQRH